MEKNSITLFPYSWIGRGKLVLRHTLQYALLMFQRHLKHCVFFFQSRGMKIQ